ncbi:MAG: ribosome maturation factor RimP [Mycobacteriales bacterium]
MSAREHQVQRLIEPVVGKAGYDVEDVTVSTAGRRRLVRVVIDGDDGVSLDDIAEVSRLLSNALDTEVDAMGQGAYTLEVTSPGVDRLLELPRHWRRAVGRLVKVDLAADREDEPSATVLARVRAADDTGVELEVDGAKRRAAYADLHRARVQVEFSRPKDGPAEERERP